MILHELQPAFPLTTECSHTHISRDGIVKEQKEEILNEHALTVEVNGNNLLHIVCLPQFLPELVLGRLCSEGIISSTDDVKELTISQDGEIASVFLSSTVSSIPKEPAVLTSIDWKPEWIFALADKFAEGMPLHEKTWATHSCILAVQDKILFDCEDIGRHNALDKVIGYALRNQIPLSKCTIYSSGRVPLDMAMKAIRAGVPLYVSKAAPTQKTIKAAKKYNLTLICAARRDRMKLFSA